MSSVNANINILVNTSQATAQIRGLQAQIGSLNKTLAATGGSSLLAQQKAFNTAMAQSAVASGLFTAKVIPMSHSVDTFSRNLDRGKLSLGQYARGVASQMPGMSRIFRREFDMMTRVAESRVKRIQTQYTALGASQKALALTPTGLAPGYATSMAVATQKQMVFNRMISDGSTKLLNWGKNTQWAGRQLMVGFSLPLIAFGAIAAKTFMDLDRQARDFKRVYGDAFTPPEEIKQNLEAIRELGDEYTKYGVKVSETMEVAATAAAAGMRNQDLIAGTEETLRLATIGQIDYNQALSTTISLQTAFKTEAGELPGIVDFIGAVANQTVLTVDDMTKAIPRVAPVIAGLGGSIQDLAALLVAMREGGVSAEQGANALKSGLASLINPTDRAIEYLSKFGINLDQIVQTNRGDLMATIYDFADAINALGGLERQQVLEKVFGKYQYARLGALFENIRREGSQAAVALDLAGKSAQELGQLSAKSLSEIEQSTTAKFEGAVERMKIAIAPVGEAFLKALTPIIEFVGKIADKFNSLPDGVKDVMGKIVVAVGIVAPVGLMLIGLFANLIANGVKALQSVRKLFAWLRKDALAFGWMAGEELDAAAASRSLEGATSKLTEKLLLQEKAVETLIRLYSNLAQSAATAAGAMSKTNIAPVATGGAGVFPMMMGKGAGAAPKSFFTQMGRPRGPKGYAGGVTSVPGTGNKDSVPALLMPGESVVTKDATKKYGPIISAMNAGTIKGLEGGYNPKDPARTVFIHATPNIALSKEEKAALRRQSTNQDITGTGRRAQYGLTNFGVLGPSLFNEKGMGNVTGSEAARLFTGSQSLLNYTMRPIYEGLAARLGVSGGAEAAMKDPRIKTAVSQLAASWAANLRAIGTAALTETAFYAAAKGGIASVEDKKVRKALNQMRTQVTTVQTSNRFGTDRSRVSVSPPIQARIFGNENAQASYRGKYPESKFALPVPMSSLLSATRMRQLGITDQSAYNAGAASVANSERNDPAVRSRSRSRNSPHPLMSIDGRDDQRAYDNARVTQAEADAAKIRSAIMSATAGLPTGPSSKLALPPVNPATLPPALRAVHSQLGLGSIPGLSPAIANQMRTILAKENAEGGRNWRASMVGAGPVTIPTSRVPNVRRFMSGSRRAAKGAAGAVGAAARAGNMAIAPWDRGSPLAKELKNVGAQIVKPWRDSLAAARQQRALAREERAQQRSAQKQAASERKAAARASRTSLGDRFRASRAGLMGGLGNLGTSVKDDLRNWRQQQLAAKQAAARAKVNALFRGLGGQEKPTRYIKYRGSDVYGAPRNMLERLRARREERAAQRAQAAAPPRPSIVSSPMGDVIQGQVIRSSKDLEKYVAPQTLRQRISSFFNQIGQAFRDGSSKFLGGVKGLPTKINNFFKSAWTATKNLDFKQIGKTMVGGIQNLGKNLIDQSKKMANNARTFISDMKQKFSDMRSGGLKALGPGGSRAAIEAARKAVMPPGYMMGGGTVGMGGAIAGTAYLNALNAEKAKLAGVAGQLRGEWQRITGIIRNSGLKEAFAQAKADSKKAIKDGALAVGRSLKDAGIGVAEAAKGAAGAIRTAAGLAGKGAVAAGGMAVGGIAAAGKGVANWWNKPNERTGMTRGQRIGQASNSAIMGLMGLSMAASFAGGSVGEMAQKVMPVTMGLMGLQMILPMLTNPMGLLIIAVSAAAAAFVKARMDIDNVAREAMAKGANIGGPANRMEEVSAATGYQFAYQREQERMFRLSDQDRKGLEKYKAYFEGEQGQKFLADLKKLSSEERYQKVGQILAQAIADGMPIDQAKEYGTAIGYYANDAILKLRLVRDFKQGKFKSGTEELVKLVTQRMDALEAAGLFIKDKQGNAILGVGEVGQSSGSRFLAEKTGIGRYDTATSLVGEGLAKTGATALLGTGLGLAGGVGLGALLGGGAAAGGAALTGSVFGAAALGGGAALTGAAAGAAGGSVVPVVGTIIGAVIGTLVGGAIAFKQYRDQVDALNKNVSTAAQTWGASIQVLKEARNAEMSLTEARRTGQITEEEYAKQSKDLAAVQERASEAFKGVVETMMVGGVVDQDALNQALTDQLVIGGFEGDLAKAVVGTVNFREIAKAMFPALDPDVLASDPQYAQQREVVKQVMVETLAGITPENAQQRINDVREQWAQISQQLLNAAQDGLTSAETQAALAGEAAKRSLANTLAGTLEENQIGSTQGMTEQEINDLINKSRDEKTSRIVGQRDIGEGDQRRRVDVYETPEGIQYTTNVQKPETLQDMLKKGGYSPTITTMGGREFESMAETVLSNNLTYQDIFGETGKGGDIEFTGLDAQALDTLASSLGKNAKDLLVQAFRENKQMRDMFEQQGLTPFGEEGFSQLFGGATGTDLQSLVRKEIIDPAKEAIPEFQSLGTEIDIVSENWGKFIDKAEASKEFGKLGLTSIEVDAAMGDLASRFPEIAQGIAENDENSQKFLETLALFTDPKYSEMDVSLIIKIATESDKDPEDIRKELDDIYKYAEKRGKDAEKAYKKKYGKEGATDLAVALNPQKIQDLYLETISDPDMMAKWEETGAEQGKTAGEAFYDTFVEEATGAMDRVQKYIIKKGKYKGGVKITTEVITDLFGNRVDDPAAVADAMNAMFGNKPIDPSFVTVWAELALTNPEAFASLGAMLNNPDLMDWAKKNPGGKAGDIYGYTMGGTADNPIKMPLYAPVGAPFLAAAGGFTETVKDTGAEDKKKGGDGGGQKEKTWLEQLIETMKANSILYQTAAKWGKKLIKDQGAFFGVIQQLRTGSRVIKGKVMQGYAQVPEQLIQEIGAGPEGWARVQELLKLGKKEFNARIKQWLADLQGRTVDRLISEAKTANRAKRLGSLLTSETGIIGKTIKNLDLGLSDEQLKQLTEDADFVESVFKALEDVKNKVPGALKILREIVIAGAKKIKAETEDLTPQEEAEKAWDNYSKSVEAAFTSAEIGTKNRMADQFLKDNQKFVSGLNAWQGLDIKTGQDLEDAMERQLVIYDKRIRAEQDNIDAKNELIAAQERLNELDQQEIEKKKRADEIALRESDALNKELEKMSKKESDIRKAYDERIKSLEKIASINQHILDQQKNQLGLADALSRGDIAAAAAAEQQMQAADAQYAMEQVKTGLQASMENQIAGLTTQGGKTREEAESRINELKEQSYQTSLEIRNIEDQIYARNVLITGYKNQIYDIENGIMKAYIDQKEQLSRILEDYKTEVAYATAHLTAAGLTRIEWERQKDIHDKVMADMDSNIKKIKDYANEWQRAASYAAQMEGLPDPYAVNGNIARDTTSAASTGQTFAEMVGEDINKLLGEDIGKYLKWSGGGMGLIFATGGMVPQRFATGGQVGMDSVPAMLTPGEFVMRKSAVDKYGVSTFAKMNMGSFALPRYNFDEVMPKANVSYVGDTKVESPMYNSYSVNVNVPNTNADPDMIANKVMTKIAEISNQNIRSVRGY